MSPGSITNSTTNHEGVADSTTTMGKSVHGRISEYIAATVEGEHDSNSTGPSESAPESVNELVFHLDDLGDVVEMGNKEEEADGNTIPTLLEREWPTGNHPNPNPRTSALEQVDWIVPFDLHCALCSYKMVEAGKAIACAVDETEHSGQDEDAGLLGQPGYRGPTKDLWAMCLRCGTLVGARWPLGPQDGMRLEYGYFWVPLGADKTPGAPFLGPGEPRFSLDSGEFPGRLRPRALR